MDTDVSPVSPAISDAGASGNVNQCIDYDKLAEAILRQSKLPELSTSQLQHGQQLIASNVPETQDHSHLLAD